MSQLPEQFGADQRPSVEDTPLRDLTPLSAPIPRPAYILFIVLVLTGILSAAFAVWAGIFFDTNQAKNQRVETPLSSDTAHSSNDAQSSNASEQSAAKTQETGPAKPKLPTIEDLKNASLQLPTSAVQSFNEAIAPNAELAGNGTVRAKFSNGVFESTGPEADKLEIDSVHPIKDGSHEGVLVHLLRTYQGYDAQRSYLLAYSPDVKLKGFLIQPSQEMVDFAPAINTGNHFKNLEVLENTIHFDVENIFLLDGQRCPECHLSVGITAAWDGEHLNLQYATYREGQREFVLTTAEQVQGLVQLIQGGQDSEARRFFTDQAWMDWDKKLGLNGRGPSHRDISFGPTAKVGECHLIQPSSEGNGYVVSVKHRSTNVFFKELLPGDMGCSLVNEEHEDVLNALFVIRPGSGGEFTVIHFAPHYG